MQLPSKVTYRGQAHDVLGYAGKKYRLSNGTFAPMDQCLVYVEPIEDISTVRSGPSELLAESALDVKPDQPKERKGGRPRKIKAAE